MGTCWASDSWAATAWVTGSWAAAAIITVLADLCTALMMYLPQLRAASLLPVLDSTSLLAPRIQVWRDADGGVDSNTIIAKALS